MLLQKSEWSRPRMTTQKPSFPGFTDAELQRLATILPKTHPYETGQTICGFGDPGDGLYIVLSGKVRMYYTPPGVGTKDFHIEGKGCFFGEVATLVDVPRSATVKAASTTELLILKPERLDDFLKDHPDLTRRILEGMAWRMWNSGVKMHETPLRDLSLSQPVKLTLSDRIVHASRQFLGTGGFLLLLGLLLALYVWRNTGKPFDPNWVGIALSLSVLQIIIGNLILNSQNRQAEAEQPLTQQEREANLHAAQDIVGMQNEMRSQYAEILHRLEELKPSPPLPQKEP